MRLSLFLRAIGLAALVALLALGCSDDSSNSVTNPSGSSGGVILLMHDAPIDSISEFWLTVDAVRFISSDEADDDTTETDDDSTGNNGNGTMLLDEPVRLNLLALDSISRVLAVVEAPAGAFSKMRLEVSDPMFKLDDGTEVMSDQIKLVANGHVDLNPQGDIIVITDAFTVVSLDLDAEKSIQVNQTGNEKYILHPQVFVDATVDSLTAVELEGAVIQSIDAGEETLTVLVPGSVEPLVIVLNGSSGIQDAVGTAMTLAQLTAGMTVAIVGHLDRDDGYVVAELITVGS